MEIPDGTSLTTIRLLNRISTARALHRAALICFLRLILCGLVFLAPVAFAREPSFHVLAFYAATGEPDHVAFADQALVFFAQIAQKNNFSFESTTGWDNLTAEKLRGFQLVVWLNDFPKTAQQREAFRDYMEHGGGWLGFHVAAYNDESTNWPWFVDFLGGAVFYGNNWPPLPATLVIDDRSHPVTRHLPANFTSPTNEWYIWKPSPRLNQRVKILLTLDPRNYPIGFKDTIIAGDLPAVWTNTKYRMIYMNMGHGDKIFTSSDQNRLFEDALLWLGTRK